MNNQEAKLILQAYRTGGQDAADPFFAGALEQARRDPELQKWFAEENAVNARLHARLETAIPVPAGLKADLLALRKTVRPASWWSQPMKLAAALVILVSFGVVFLLLSQKPSPLASFRETMARSSAQMQEHVAFESHDFGKIQQWLQSRNLDTNFDLPAMLQAGIPQGCRTVDWNGSKATMICFFVNGQHMDLFVIDRTGLPAFPENGAPQFAQANGLMTATWASGGKVYLLVGQNKELLQKVL
ncbi:MAG TPA: hypothetical protein VMH87_11265 [Pseudomonadales bacterium]|nr:hypothetical protein [Pseudomonadales bacterium]